MQINFTRVMAAESKRQQIRLLVLNQAEKLDGTVFRLQTGWKLSFACSPGLQSKSVRLFCNYPLDSSLAHRHTIAFDQKHAYQELVWRRDDDLSEGYDSVTAPLSIQCAGPFHYYFTIDGSDVEGQCNGCGYIIVDPVLHYGFDDEKLSMDAVQIQTVLPKLLGSFSEWKSRLEVSRHTGYNMIHFTPTQKLNAESNSSYSISDQLTLNPAFSTPERKYDYKDMADLVQFMKDEWHVLSLTDMVYNHTANDSQWLVEHPESSYNLCNSPHLKPAFLLDRIIWYTSQDVSEGKLKSRGLSNSITCEQHVQTLAEVLTERIVDLKLEEFYIVDLERAANSFKAALNGLLANIEFYNLQPKAETIISDQRLEIEQCAHYTRLDSYVDYKKAMNSFVDQVRNLKELGKNDADIVRKITEIFLCKLSELNQVKIDEVQGHIKAAVNHVISGVRYRFLDDKGPKYATVTAQHPLVHLYFVNNKPIFKSKNIEDDENLIGDTQTCKYVMAHNGWVMGDDPLRNFAESDSNVYLRRELVAWGDSVKLRYGNSPKDCPYLWQRMEEYTRTTAQIFHGIRLDNCHSTPIHVAEYMIRLARSVRPNLYVVAELFTSHEEIDNIFVNRLGLNSLIREGLSAWDAHEQGRLVYKYGGRPVGSFFQPSVQILKPTVAHALFMDATHDNESVIQKRTVQDTLALSAFVNMSCCATGSNRGYDEMVPEHIHVVQEKRLYQSWSSTHLSDQSEGLCNGTTGMIAAKEALNRLHQLMGQEGYDQVYVHDLSSDTVSIVRHNPNTHQSYICVARTAFSLSGGDNSHCDPLQFEGSLNEVWLHAQLVPSSDNIKFCKNEEYVNGLKSHVIKMKRNVSINSLTGMKWSDEGNKQKIELIHFPPGSVLIISVKAFPELTNAIEKIHKTVSSIRSNLISGDNSQSGGDIREMMDKLTLTDLNVVLYHCDAEERACTGYGTYDVPRFGPLIYAGLEGVFTWMSRVRASNDLGHPLCDNLRQGDWLVEYIVGRLAQYSSLKQFAAFLEACFVPLKDLPRYLNPCYFDVILMSLSMLVHQSIWNKMSRFVKNGNPFVKMLASSSLQFCGYIKSSQLSPLHPEVERAYKHSQTGELIVPSIAAGLPHFSEGIMRNWGRDTFISLRGLLLVTGRVSEARAIILSFAGTLRHGLIPNLLGEGRHARYNCRDAVWWWLQSVQDYCNMTTDGLKILADNVSRMYPTDESKPCKPGKKSQLLQEVIQEALQRHAGGVSYRERGAGSQLDRDMSESGFDVSVGIDWETGFVYGGSEFNCGTWMDKMGSSHKAGNAGRPATPRNGSAVELVGLQASAVRWLATLHKRGRYPYAGVQGKRKDWTEEKVISFEIWYNLIKKNFERSFWLDSTYTTLESDPRPDLINKRNVYKDSLGAKPEWADYQLRPNFTVAMVVAPGLFHPENAWNALSNVEEFLLGPLGLKTLDPTDWAYDGDYVNSNDSDDPKVAAGSNYHNGPEWVWPVGYFLRAKLVMAQKLESSNPDLVGQTIKYIQDRLAAHHMAVTSSNWKSLPELTNAGGKVCVDSCPAQAWSISCIMDTLYDVQKAQE